MSRHCACLEFLSALIKTNIQYNLLDYTLRRSYPLHSMGLIGAAFSRRRQGP